MENNIVDTVIKISLMDNQLNLVEDFKEHLEAAKKPATNYNYASWRSNNPPCDDREIYFYEFSDILRQPRKFTKVSEFLAWAKSVNIFTSSYTENELRTNPVNYGTCYDNSSTMMVRHSYEDLKNSFETYKRNNIYNSCYNRARCYEDGYDDDYYGDWY